MTSRTQGDQPRFDPYYKWLGIPPEEQPPDYYRLLGIRRFEADEEVIQNAADQRMALLKGFSSGERSEFSQKLLNEVSAARVVLLNPKKKRAYDQTLRSGGRAPADTFRVEGDEDEAVDHEESRPPPPPPAVALESIIAAVSEPRSGRKASSKPRRKSRVPDWAWIAGAAAITLLAGLLASVLMNMRRSNSADSTLAEQSAGAKPSAGKTQAALEAAAGKARASSAGDKDGKSLAAPGVKLGPDGSPTPDGETPSRKPDVSDSTVDQAIGPTAPEAIPPDKTKRETPNFRTAAPATRKPLPDQAAQDKARAKVQEQYQDDMTLAQGDADKKALAQKMYEQAVKVNDDPARQYALFCMAAEMARDAGEWFMAWQALDEVGRYFETEVLPRKEEYLRSAVKRAKAPSEFRPFVDAWAMLAQVAVKRDDYVEALRYLEEVTRCASKTNDKALQKTVAVAATHVRETQTAFPEAQKAKEALQRNADDAEAAWAWGRFLCVYKNEWVTGLPFWAKGADREGVTVATRDRATGFDTEGRIKTGDAWWDLAEKQPGVRPRYMMHERAAYWYRLALSSATGPAKARIEKRLQQSAPRALEPPRPEGGRANKGP